LRGKGGSKEITLNAHQLVADLAASFSNLGGGKKRKKKREKKERKAVRPCDGCRLSAIPLLVKKRKGRGDRFFGIQGFLRQPDLLFFDL